MGYCDLLSDLHLHPARPQLTRIFVAYLQESARGAQALYLLGDIFEYWIGDDAGIPAYQDVISALHALSAHGVSLYFVHGNRDFLVGKAFAAATGATLLPSEYTTDIGGTITLLLHGDRLCTDDVEHQRFLAVALDPAVQQRILSLPIAQREQIAHSLRLNSHAVKRYKAEDIMDVNQAAVEDALHRHGVARMIHGHTHRPATHEFTLNGQPAQRIVLADWREHGHVLRVDASGTMQAISLS